MLLLILDILLGTALLILAFQVVSGRTLFASLVMFTVFGLLMAVVWARLGAPDLALAEAAIGAGLTGAMLMLCYRRLVAIEPDHAGSHALKASRLAAPLALLCALLVGVLLLTLPGLPALQQSAGDHALQAMPQTPVSNPVTAVLLLFRGYDTLLEMAVLLAAWLGVVVVQGRARPPQPADLRAVSLLDALMAMLIPTAVLLAGYLLNAGGKAPGGAFQAGAVLAGAGVLLALGGRLRQRRVPLPLLSWGLSAGVLVFVVIGLLPLFNDSAILDFPAMWQIYLVEAAMTLSIALTLVLLFLGAASMERRR